MLSAYPISYLKKAAVLLCSFALSYGALAQQKVEITTDTDSSSAVKSIKPVYRKAEPGSDVDRLWELYRDTDIVLIPIGDREVKAHVKIYYNDDKKPYTVIAYGEADADTAHALNKLVRNLGNEKLHAGYRQIPGHYTVTFNPGGGFENVFEVTLYQKGNQFAKYGIKKAIYNESRGDNAPQYVGDSFYFEVVDEGRRPGNKSKKFVF